MQLGDLLAQAPMAAVGVGPQVHLTQGTSGCPRQGKGGQGGTGIQDLIRPAPQAPSRDLQIAAVGFHPTSLIDGGSQDR